MRSRSIAPLALAATATVALFAGAVPTATAAAPTPVVTVTQPTTSTVDVELAGFGENTSVAVTAVANGTGRAVVKTKSDTASHVQFQPPPGFSGAVRVTATSPTHTVIGSVAFKAGAGATPAAKAPSGACATGGSGGPNTDVLDQTFTDSAGNESKYHLYASGLAATKPTGLLLYFHGDGAYEIEHPDYALPEIQKAGKQHNLLTVAMLTPDAATTTWWKDGETNAAWVSELIKKVAFARYDIDRSQIWLVGYSGGSQFITQNLVADNSSLLCGGGAIIFGGGGKPSSINSIAPALATNFKMHWYTGQNDTGADDEGYNALADSDRGAAFYRGLGFTTTVEHPAGVNHGNIPFAKVVAQQLDAQGAGGVKTPTAGSGTSR